MTEASKILPAGYQVIVTTTTNHSENVGDGGGTSQHTLANAMDVQIVGPNGVVPNTGSTLNTDPTGLYRQLAVAAYRVQQSTGADCTLAWGGNFYTTKTSGIADYMHYDCGGDRSSNGVTLSAEAAQ